MKHLNRLGQGIIGIGIGLLIFGLVWILGLSSWLSGTMATYTTLNNITGLQAFFYVNINLWIGIFYILAWIVLTKLG